MTGHVDSDALRSLVERRSMLTRESGSEATSAARPS